MIVGILSDSHGKIEAVRAAVWVLRRNGAQRLFHCGDVGGIDVLGEMLETPTRFVWGNMDRPDGAAYTYCETVGLPWPVPPVTVEMVGKRIALCHGHEPFCRSLIENEQFDYVLFGHTHEPKDTRRGKTRIINPGALQRAPIKTVATLDLPNDRLTFYEVPSGRVVRLRRS